MKLEQQVVSLELAKKLKDLGVKQEKDGLFFWVKALYLDRREEWKIWSKWEIEYEGDMDLDKEQDWCSAFTDAEIGSMLPPLDGRGYIQVTKFTEDDWHCEYAISQGNILRVVVGKTEAEARAKMLIFLIESQYVAP